MQADGGVTRGGLCRVLTVWMQGPCREAHRSLLSATLAFAHATDGYPSQTRGWSKAPEDTFDGMLMFSLGPSVVCWLAIVSDNFTKVAATVWNLESWGCPVGEVTDNLSAQCSPFRDSKYWRKKYLFRVRSYSISVLVCRLLEGSAGVIWKRPHIWRARRNPVRGRPSGWVGGGCNRQRQLNIQGLFWAPTGSSYPLARALKVYNETLTGFSWVYWPEAGSIWVFDQPPGWWGKYKQNPHSKDGEGVLTSYHLDPAQVN